jgi:hypothetical protein
VHYFYCVDDEQKRGKSDVAIRNSELKIRCISLTKYSNCTKLYESFRKKHNMVGWDSVELRGMPSRQFETIF